MTQASLFPIDQVDPAEVEAPEHHIARQQAAADWNAVYLSNFYARKAAAILASGNLTRVNLYFDFLAQATQREGMAA